MQARLLSAKCGAAALSALGFEPDCAAEKYVWPASRLGADVAAARGAAVRSAEDELDALKTVSQ